MEVVWSTTIAVITKLSAMWKTRHGQVRWWHALPGAGAALTYLGFALLTWECHCHRQAATGEPVIPVYRPILFQLGCPGNKGTDFNITLNGKAFIGTGPPYLGVHFLQSSGMGGEPVTGLYTGSPATGTTGIVHLTCHRWSTSQCMQPQTSQD